MKKAAPTLRFCAVQGSFWMSYSAVFAFASVFLLARGFSNREIGFVVAAGSALSAILQPRFGAYADSRRKCVLHRLIIIVSLIMIALAGLLLTVTKNFWIIALLYGLLVAFLQVNTPLTYSLGMFFINKGVPVNFGVARACGSLAYAILSTIVGKLVEKYSTNVIMYSVILVYVLLIISTVTFHFKGTDEINTLAEEQPGDQQPETGSTGATGQKKRMRSGLLRNHPRFAIVLLGSVFLFVSHNLISNYIYQIVSYHGYSSAEMGLAISISAVLEIPMLSSFNLINLKFTSGALLKTCGFFFAIRSLILLLAGNLAMIYLAQLAQPFGYGLYVGASVYYVNHTIEEEHRVEGQAYMTLTCAAGAVLGSLIGGWLIDIASVPTMLIFGTSVAALGTLIINAAGEKGRCQSKKEKEGKIMSNIYEGIEGIIGNTPLVELKNIERKYNLEARLLVKVEYLNPAGSAKDRVALEMIRQAEADGKLAEGGTIIEPTSGNTGIGLAAIGIAKGYRVIIVLPDTMSVERRNIIKAYGAEVVLSDGRLGMKGAIEKAEELRDTIPGSFIPDQFGNPANPAAHRKTTGPEIWRDTDGQVDAFVAGVGTGGTLTGTGEYLRQMKPDVKIVAMEPASSPLLSKGVAGPHGIQGIGANFVPSILNRDLYDEIITVTDEAAIEMGKEISSREGLLVGISSGAALWAAIEVAKRPEMKGKTVVALLPDSGDRYYSTDLFKFE